jgi:hypothetical protein
MRNSGLLLTILLSDAALAVANAFAVVVLLVRF